MKLLALLCAIFLFSLKIHAAITISTEDELEALMNTVNPDVDWALDYELTADLNMTGKTCKPIGNGDGTSNTTPFTGSFNGNGHVVRNITISGFNDLGFFGYTDGASIKNLSIDNIQLSGFSWVGGLCGWLNNSVVLNCNVQGVVYCTIIGGIFCGSIDNESTVKYCYSEGSIIGTGFSGVIGGFAGGNDNSLISNCYSTGSVSGGIVLSGFCASNINGGIIKNCYCTGNVTGNNDVGGFCSNNESYIGFCYSSSKPTGSFAAGFVANDDNGTYECNYWDIDKSELTDGVGSSDPDPEGVYGLQSAQFSDPSSFQNASCGFDFDGTWMIVDGRPVLTDLTIPTLSEWAVIIFIGLLVSIGGWFVWKRS
jgi:hypothetical protein